MCMLHGELQVKRNATLLNSLHFASSELRIFKKEHKNLKMFISSSRRYILLVNTYDEH